MLVSEQGVTLSPARPRPTTPTHLLSYTTLFRSVPSEPFLPTRTRRPTPARSDGWSYRCSCTGQRWYGRSRRDPERCRARSEEHTSELQSPMYLVFRLLLEKKNVRKQFKTAVTVQ